MVVHDQGEDVAFVVEGVDLTAPLARRIRRAVMLARVPAQRDPMAV